MDKELIKRIGRFAHRQEDEMYILTLSESEIWRLNGVLTNGFEGSYYDSGRMPKGPDIRDVLMLKSSVEFRLDRLDKIARFYEMGLDYLLDVLSSDEEYEDFLYRRSLPYDDPW
jgi:hypothetical protein